MSNRSNNQIQNLAKYAHYVMNKFSKILNVFGDKKNCTCTRYRQIYLIYMLIVNGIAYADLLNKLWTLNSLMWSLSTLYQQQKTSLPIVGLYLHCYTLLLFSVFGYPWKRGVVLGRCQSELCIRILSRTLNIFMWGNYPEIFPGGKSVVLHWCLLVPAIIHAKYLRSTSTS